ncbi:MAG: hypothetical protein SGARI_008256 [Bacillariaceae sp.]
MCTFDEGYYMMNCTVLSGAELLEQLEVTCRVNKMFFGSAVACRCNGMARGFMDGNSDTCKDYGCMSEHHEDWTDDCQWCYVERQCGQCILDSSSAAMNYNFILPWYANFVSDVKQAYQDMEDNGEEEYLMEGLAQYANAYHPPVDATSILWNVLGQDCYEERLAEDGVSMIQTPVADEGHSHVRSNAFALGIALVASAVIGAAIYIGYRSWEKRQYKIYAPDTQSSLL